MRNESYNFFGIDERTPASELKKIYRQRMRDNHPDTHGNTEEEKISFANKCKDISHHYKVLTDPSYTAQSELYNKVLVYPVEVNVLNAVVGVKFSHHLAPKSIITENKLDVQRADINHSVIELTDFVKFKSFTPIATEHKDIQLGDKTVTIVFSYSVDAREPYFNFNGKLGLNIHVPVMTLLKGGKLEVQTVFGIKTIRIPAGSMPGRIIPLHRCGFNGEPLHCHISNVIFSDKNGMKSEEFNELGIDWAFEDELDKEDRELELALRKFNL